MKGQLPPTDQILAAITVARHGNVTKAAQELEVSQPGLSRQVIALEKMLGFRLFDRIGRMVRLTVQGEEMIQRVTPLLEELSRVTSNLSATAGTASGRVRLGTTESVAINNLPAILRPYLAANRRVNLRLVCHTSEVIPDLVERGEVDIGVAAIEEHPAKLTCVKLWDEDMVLVLPVNHIGRSRVIVNYLNEDFILLPGSTVTRRLINRCLDQLNVRLKVVLEHDSPEVIKAMVVAGLGLAILPEPSVRRETRRGELAAWPLSDLKAVRSIVALTNPRRQPWPAELALLEALQGYGR